MKYNTFGARHINGWPFYAWRAWLAVNNEDNVPDYYQNNAVDNGIVFG